MRGLEKTDSKYQRLQEIFDEMESVVVAFSGGVDSALVLAVAHRRLGERAVAATSISPTVPASQLEEARAFADALKVRHLFIRSDELQIPGYAENPLNRCFLCKNDLYTQIAELSRREGIGHLADGTNLDDLSDYRPGLQAARSLGIRSPLVEAGLTKGEVRALSRELGLPTWDKPASACLSSRFPYGTEITYDRLQQVEQAEEALRALGFRQFRVRYHGETARIELASEEFHRTVDAVLRSRMAEKIQACGFRFVVLDLQGYRSGSLNEGLNIRQT